MATAEHPMSELLAAGLLAFTVASLADVRPAWAGNPVPGSAPVNVVAPLPLPVTDVGAPAREPFQTTLCLAVGANPVPCPADQPASYPVPADRRLVIEYVSGQCPSAGTTLQTGESFSALLQTVVGGTAASHLVRITPGIALASSSTLGLNGFEVAQPTRIYADPDSQVTLALDVGGLAGIYIRCRLALSGYTETP